MSEEVLKTILYKLENLEKTVGELKNGQDNLEKTVGELKNGQELLVKGQIEIREDIKTIHRKLDTIYQQVAENTELKAKLRYRLKRAFVEE